MRIAYISLMSGLPWGGSEAYWSEKAFESLKKGDKVFISVYDWGKDTHSKIKELQNQGAQIHLRKRFSHDVPLTEKIFNFLKNRISKLNHTWTALFNFKPDQIIINQGSNIDLAVHHYVLYQKIHTKKIPYKLICHSHPQYSFIPDKNVYPRGKDVFINAEKVLFVSKRQKCLTERAICTQLSNTQIFQNPLNLSKKELLKYPESNTIKMAVVGALVSGKGHDTLFEVLSQSQWKNRNWQLNIYGKAYGLQYLKDLAEYFNIKEKICFCGFVNSATEIWQKNHILLIPSDGEGLPISLVEAAVSGRTAVVTDVGGNTEIIVDNKNGFVACAPTPHSFSEALERAWRRKNEWQEMGKDLREEIIKTI
ncbi:MAG: glycosyltransferase [Bacteroidales bacterium]|nr:glycosyltransferase [Bacteroidales bacterium]